jgi:hypothetical protein
MMSLVAGERARGRAHQQRWTPWRPTTPNPEPNQEGEIRQQQEEEKEEEREKEEEG